MVQTSGMNYLIFTDLDGTLLHPRTYSFEAARAALDMVKERGIPLIFISSKTRPEVELWRSRLFNEHPFIVENGGGIFIPRGYFPFPVDGVAKDGYQMIALGLSYDEVRSRFAALREKLGIAVRGFGDMTPEEVMDLTGLTHEEALLAKQRDFGEPFVFSKKTEERFLAEIEGAGLTWTRGLLFHIMGDHHKGRAAKILRKLYERQYGSVTTIGIGDSLNDLPFLLTVDRPVLVRKLSGLHEAKIDMPGLLRTNGVGPAGWNEAVTEILKAAPSRP